MLEDYKFINFWEENKLCRTCVTTHFKRNNKEVFLRDNKPWIYIRNITTSFDMLKSISRNFHYMFHWSHRGEDLSPPQKLHRETTFICTKEMWDTQSSEERGKRRDVSSWKFPTSWYTCVRNESIETTLVLYTYPKGIRLEAMRRVVVSDNRIKTIPHYLSLL